MSLLDDYMENFTIIDKHTELDGYGGIKTFYTDGATIQAALSFDNSTGMKIAEAAGVKTAYTITVKKIIKFDIYTLLKRQADGQIFRVVNNGDDNATPASASLDMRQYSAEMWILPNDDDD